MKQISILLSYVLDDYLKTCKLLEVPSPVPLWYRLQYCVCERSIKTLFGTKTERYNIIK